MMRLRSGAMSAQMWHLCAFILICLWHVAFAYAEQNESPVPRNISINLQGASPYQVLDALAKEIGKGWIAGELPDKKYDVRIVQAPPLEAIINVADALGIQLELWRGLLIAEPASPGNSLRDKLRQALPKDVAELLLRPPDNGSIAAPGFELVLNAIKALYRHDNSPNGHSAVLKAAYWMAAPELRTIIIPYDSACDGTAVIRMLPRSHWVHWLREPELDTCQYHMVFGIPATGLDEPPNRPIAFHERGYDYFAELLRKEKGLISVAEYKRRIVNACRKRDDPISKIANVMESISINGNGIPLGELGRQIAQMTKVNVKVSDALATKRVWLNVKDAITADVLLATARVAGGVWALSNDMKGCEIDVPRITLEQLDTALPLIMWCPAHLTAAEANMVRQDYINAFFD
ncbi:MAG TPA: hypothetical protein EYP10_13445, partial [Armatimonadetes bacterium]|nr:hypothetical protein [Armatimonadota bacterium]